VKHDVKQPTQSPAERPNAVQLARRELARIFPEKAPAERAAEVEAARAQGIGAWTAQHRMEQAKQAAKREDRRIMSDRREKLVGARKTKKKRRGWA